MPTSTFDRAGVAVRPAAVEDSAVVWRLWVALQDLHAKADPANYRPAADQSRFQKYFEKALGDNGREVMVAERSGEIVGYTILRDVQRGADFVMHVQKWLEVDHLSVAEEARRTGVANALLEQARLIAQRRGLSRIKVGVRAFNASAIEAYERLGFAHDFHHMSLRLDNEGHD